MRKYFLILCSLILLVGCTPNYLIEQLGVINTKGVDRTEDNQLASTFIYYQFDPEAKRLNEIVSAQSKTWKGTVTQANLKTRYRLVPDKLEVEVFGKSIAEEGIIPIVDTLFRSAKTPDTMYFAIADQTAKEVLTTLFENSSGNAGNALQELIKYNINQEIIMTCTLRDFRHRYYKTGIDPILPVIKMENKNPVIHRVALFQNDRMVGDISTEELFSLKLMARPYQTGKAELTLPLAPFQQFIPAKERNKHSEQKFHVALSEIKSNNKIKLISTEDLTYRAEITVKAQLTEISEQLRIEDEKILKKIEEQITLQIEDKMQQILTKFQELNTDPIGFGSIYRTKSKLTEGEWRQKFPEIKVDFNVKVNLLRFGTTQ